MSKNILIFIGAFFIGALVTLAIRTAKHDPYTPAETVPIMIKPADAMETHEHAEAAPATDAKPVNTVCPICGMEVDPDVATAMYEGIIIGFGCKNCPPKFAAEPEAFGPSALENKVAE